MSYRGTIKNGVVVLEPGAELPEGSEVEVISVQATAQTARPAVGELPAFGLWRNRQDLPDSGEASLDLRRQMERRSK